jgi:hypothetical protein
MNEAEVLGVVLAVIVLGAVLLSTRWFARRMDAVQTAVSRDLEMSAHERDLCREQIEHWQTRFYAERSARNEIWAQHQIMAAVVREKLGYEAVREAQISARLVPSLEEQMRLVDLLTKSNLLNTPESRDELLVGQKDDLVRTMATLRRSSPRLDLAAIIQTTAEWGPAAFKTMLDQIEDKFESNYVAKQVQALRAQWGI